MSSSEIVLKCHKIIGGYAEGEALVSDEAICFYLVDPKTGKVVERNHRLEGKNVADKVLVFSSGKASSVVQVDGLFKLALNKTAPRAMIVNKVETVLVVSAMLANIPLVDKLEKNPLEIIRTGDLVKVDANKETVTVIKRE